MKNIYKHTYVHVLKLSTKSDEYLFHIIPNGNPNSLLKYSKQVALTNQFQRLANYK